MKVKRGKDVYEITKNGKPLVGEHADMEAFVLFLPSCFRFVAVASFPLGLGPEAEDCLRAMTFAVDEDYVDTVAAAVEKKWPGSVTKGGKMSQMAKKHKRHAPGCRGPGAKTK